MKYRKNIIEVLNKYMIKGNGKKENLSTNIDKLLYGK